MVSVETAKAVVELPAPVGGLVSALHAAAGDMVPTGAPLVDFDSGTVVGTMPVTSDEEFVDTGHGRRRLRPGPVRGRAVPVARALAKRLGVHLASIPGTGRGGLITLDDVLKLAQFGVSAPARPWASARAGVEPAPLRGARRAMAHSMSLRPRSGRLQHGVRRCGHRRVEPAAATTWCD